jgi:ferrochelatase
MDEIRPFLANVLRGRNVPAARVEQVAHHYELFGGISPITELTRRQAQGLRRRLEEAGTPLPVYLGMRNWHPFIDDTIREMSKAGIRRGLGFIMAAQASYSSCQQYRENVRDARQRLRDEGEADVEITYVPAWFNAPGFVEANTDRVRQAMLGLSDAQRVSTRLIFTAHSIPLTMAERSQYREQLLESSRLVAERVGMKDWSLVYQSRSGRPQDPWLEPDVCDFLRQTKHEGASAAVVCPIGFVCDHIEVLYDLDHEAAAVAREIDLPMVRAEAVNDHPAFLDAMTATVQSTVRRYAGGRPLAIVPAS